MRFFVVLCVVEVDSFKLTDVDLGRNACWLNDSHRTSRKSEEEVESAAKRSYFVAKRTTDMTLEDTSARRAAFPRPSCIG